MTQYNKLRMMFLFAGMTCSESAIAVDPIDTNAVVAHKISTVFENKKPESHTDKEFFTFYVPRYSSNHKYYCPMEGLLMRNENDKKLQKNNKTLAIFLHGSPGQSVQDFYELDALLEKCDIATYDRAGAGKYGEENKFLIQSIINGKKFFSAHVKDLENFIEECEKKLGERKIILVGYSMGTLISSLFAANYPEKVSLLINIASVPLDKANCEQWEKLSLARQKEELGDIVKKNAKDLDIRKIYCSEREEEWDDSYLPYMKAIKNIFTGHLNNNLLKDNANYFEKELQKITTLTFLIHGKNDIHVGGKPVVNYLQSKIKDSYTVILEGDHYLLDLNEFDNPNDEVNSSLNYIVDDSIENLPDKEIVSEVIEEVVSDVFIA